MSHNVYMLAYDGHRSGFPYQTPTDVSYVAMNQGGTGALEKDLATLRYLRNWAHREFGPRPLHGKDARNIYMLSKQKLETYSIDEKFDGMEAELRRRAPYIARQLVLT